jgi:hypothetical protein
MACNLQYHCVLFMWGEVPWNHDVLENGLLCVVVCGLKIVKSVSRALDECCGYGTGTQDRVETRPKLYCNVRITDLRGPSSALCRENA